MEEDSLVWKKRQEFSLNTDFEVIIGQPSRGGNRGRFSGRGSFKEECSLGPNGLIRKVK